MPLYEYECSQCHRRIERIQSFSAEPLRVCEACGGPLEKLISAPAFQFKGSGWYVTDYAKSGGSSGASSSKSESKPSESGKAESAKDAKPATAGGDSGGAASAPASGTTSTPKT